MAQAIKDIAKEGSCVIVGRAADYVLKDHEDLFRVFIYAPKEYRVKRIMEVYGDSYDAAKKHVRHSDEARASYYKKISGLEWGDRENYDLIVNSSIGLEESAELICSHIRIIERDANR